MTHADNSMERLAHDLTQIVLPLGVALSTEKDPDRLLERILVEAKSICNADAGLLFLRTADDLLRMVIRHSVPVAGLPQRAAGDMITSPPLRMYEEETGAENHQHVATRAALLDQTVNVPDVYHTKEFDFSGTKAFDRKHSYRTTSILGIPLKNYADRVIGVFELINAKDLHTRRVVPFSSYHQLVAESLASLATVALNNQRLLAALEARVAELGAIYEIGQTISASVELETTLTYILTAIKSIIPFDAAEICLLDNHRPVLQLAAGPESTTMTQRQYPPDSGYLGYILQTAQSLLIADMAKFADAQPSPDRTWHQHLTPQAYLGVPLKTHDKLIGVIELVCMAVNGFDENNRRVLETIAAQAAVAIQNAREVAARERRLKEQIRELRIQIDETKQKSEVEQIVNTDYFQNLQARAEQIRERKKRKPR